MTKKKKTDSVANIKPSQFKKMQKDLKALNTGWVELLVKQIQDDPFQFEAFNEINEKKIYNIFSGAIKNKTWRVKLYFEATTLKNRLQKSLAESVENSAN